MLVISKKAMRFVLRDKNNEPLDTRVVRPSIITQLPEWVKDDELFKLAKKEGSITFVEHQKVIDVPGEPPKIENNEGGSDDKPPKTENDDKGENKTDDKGDSSENKADDKPPKDEPPKTGRGSRQRG